MAYMPLAPLENSCLTHVLSQKTGTFWQSQGILAPLRGHSCDKCCNRAPIVQLRGRHALRVRNVTIPADVKSVAPGYRPRTKPQSGGTAWGGSRVETSPQPCYTTKWTQSSHRCALMFSIAFPLRGLPNRAPQERPGLTHCHGATQLWVDLNGTCPSLGRQLAPLALRPRLTMLYPHDALCWYPVWTGDLLTQSKRGGGTANNSGHEGARGDSDAWESQEHYAARAAMAVAQGDLSLMLLGDGFANRHSKAAAWHARAHAHRFGHLSDACRPDGLREVRKIAPQGAGYNPLDGERRCSLRYNSVAL